MIFTTFKRITRTGFVNFWRNGFLSFAAIVVITLSLSAFGGLVFASAFGRSLLADVKDKVDINVYFTLTAPEKDILALQKEIEALPEVADVTYVSAEKALSSFKEKWQNNALIMQGLTEVGGNPFPAALNVKAKDPGQYGNIANFLTSKNTEDQSGSTIIDKVNYEENKIIIDRLSAIIPTVEQVGLTVSLILILVAIIIVWNTIRLIIYTAKDEIAVMKLVGASNIYVRGPFIISGIMYGVVSAILTLVLMAGFAYWSDSIVLRLAGVDVAANFSLIVNVLSAYFVHNFPQIFILIMGSGILLGGVASYVAARKYLRV
ncbi:MAG: permease-like cell division protein FtsX [Candidatus Pacebacteria bacterium]|nr:permease-like cell division protein FtsX [Candidatus Paceibacterota bacterium]